MHRQRLVLWTVQAFFMALGFVAAVRAQTPVVHWSFEGGAATNRGSGGATYNATLSGAFAFTNGIDGDGLCLLGGSQGYAKLSYTYGSRGTVALWYKPSRFYQYNSVYDNSIHSEWWEMWIYQDGRVRSRINNADTSGVEYDLDNLNGSNHWYHIAFVWDNVSTNVTRLFIDGVERQSGKITAWVAPGTNVYFGGHTGNSSGEGVLDDVRIYDTALTAVQVQSVYEEIAARVPAVRIPFDGSATNAGIGGVRYNGTVNGGSAVWTNGWNGKGQALGLFGTNDFVSVPYRLPTSGTVALWYYVPGPWYNYNSVFDNAVDANHYECWIDSLGRLYFRPASGPIMATCDLGGGSNRWYHIVGTWDALSSNIVLYVNGVERGRAVNTNGVAWPVAGANFYIGGGNAGNTNGQGIARDLQIFETALTSNRVAEIRDEFVQSWSGQLVAYLPFDGSAVDVAGSNAVVVTGSPSYVKGKVGNGLSYEPVATPGDGGSCVSVSNALGSSIGTIAMWFYARGPWYNYHPLMDNSANSEYWEGWIYENGELAIRVSNLPNGGRVAYDLDNLGGTNNWYHIAFTWNRFSQQAKLYINGVLRDSQPLSDTGWVNPDPTLRIGSFWSGNKAANGVWDGVRVYDSALTAEEITDLMVIPPPRGTGLFLR